MINIIVWPVAVVFLGFGFMLIFKHSINDLINRIKRIDKSGLETFESSQIQTTTVKPDPLTEFLSTYDNPLLREQESEIEKDLEKRGLTNSSASHKALVRSLAGTQILLHFERVQQIIWASQIALLNYLNSKADAVPVSEATPFYEAGRKYFNKMYQNYSFDQWLSFLESHLLIEYKYSKISLSKAGREFLKWRIEVGRVGPFYG